MSLNGQLHTLAPGSKVHLYTLDLNSIGVAEVYHFYAGQDTDGSSIEYLGDTYLPWYVELTNVKRTATGPSPRPVAVVGNYQHQISDLCQLHQGLVGAKVRRRTTLAAYVISDTAEYKDDFYFIERPAKELDNAIEFELSSPLDFLDKQLPGLIAIATGCPHRYKSVVGGSGCSWPGTNPAKWFAADDSQVFSASQDVCSHKLTGCKLRFGANNPLDYGGNPGLGRSNV
jgi:lambda family phage minor tail protein L